MFPLFQIFFCTYRSSPHPTPTITSPPPQKKKGNYEYAHRHCPLSIIILCKFQGRKIQREKILRNEMQQKPRSVPWTVTSRDISSMLSTYTNNAAIWITNIFRSSSPPSNLHKHNKTCYKLEIPMCCNTYETITCSQETLLEKSNIHGGYEPKKSWNRK